MVIEEYRFGFIRIGGQVYQKDVILLADRVISPWWRNEGHRVTLEDLVEVIEAAPRLLLLGTGYYGRMQAPASVRTSLEQRGIQVETAPSAETVERYNAIADEHTAAALHLTC